jgi:hypothetical protein
LLPGEASIRPLPAPAPRSAAAPVREPPASDSQHAVTAAPKPLLASEVLADELAPLEPMRHSCRFWLLGVAAGLTVLGMAMRDGVGVPASRLEGSSVSFSAAGAVTAVALLPFPYALRAGVALLLGAVLTTMGLRGSGPLAGLVIDGAELHSVARLVAATTLPAALMLRSRYTQAPLTRWLLAVAWLSALPLLGLQVLLCIDPVAPMVSRILAGVLGFVLVCSLCGFAQAGARGSMAWAGLLLVMVPTAFALRELTPLASAEAGLLTYAAAGFGILCATLLTSLGLFQLLAAAIGPQARAALKRKRAAGGASALNTVDK